MTAASCAKCGDCCEAIYLNGTKRALRQVLRDEKNWLAGWAYWKGQDYEGKPDPYPDAATAGLWIQEKAENARFILKHWHRLSRAEATEIRARLGAASPTPKGIRFSCDAFDPVARLCTAHDERPPICRGFPWYGHGPSLEDAERRLYKRCSYWHDIPRERWPAHTAPLESPS